MKLAGDKMYLIRTRTELVSAIKQWLENDSKFSNGEWVHTKGVRKDRTVTAKTLSELLLGLADEGSEPSIITPGEVNKIMNTEIKKLNKVHRQTKPVVGLDVARAAIREYLLSRIRIVMSEGANSIWFIQIGNTINRIGVNPSFEKKSGAFATLVSHLMGPISMGGDRDAWYVMSDRVQSIIEEVNSESDKPTKLGVSDLVQEVLREFTEGGTHLIPEENYCTDSQFQTISWDTETPASQVLDSSLLVDGPTPYWDDALARMDYPDQFMAWIAGTFDPKHVGRRVLWLYGTKGCGKSAITNALSNFLSKVSVAYRKQSNQFSEAMFHRKHLVVIGDTRDQDLFDRDIIRKLTGRNLLTAEEKHEKAITYRAYSRIIVDTNILPRMDLVDDAAISRLLLVQIKPVAIKKFEAEQALLNELGSFIYKCQKRYEEMKNGTDETGMPLIATDGDIEMPTSMLRYVSSRCVSKHQAAASWFYRNRLRITPGETVLANVVWSKVKAAVSGIIGEGTTPSRLFEDKRDEVLFFIGHMAKQDGPVEMLVEKDKMVFTNLALIEPGESAEPMPDMFANDEPEHDDSKIEDETAEDLF